MVARVRIGMAIAATALLGACSSDDTAGSAAETSVSSTSVLAGSAGRPEPTSTEPNTDQAPESTAAPATADTDGSDTGATTDCIVGEWVLDGAQFVANAAAFHGEPVRYESGTYVYTFSDDGSFTVDVGLNIVIDGEEGPVRVESRGTEEGTWLVSDVSPARTRPRVRVRTGRPAVRPDRDHRGIGVGDRILRRHHRSVRRRRSGSGARRCRPDRLRGTNHGDPRDGPVPDRLPLLPHVIAPTSCRRALIDGRTCAHMAS
jgi:hypothetical protein